MTNTTDAARKTLEEATFKQIFKDYYVKHGFISSEQEAKAFFLAGMAAGPATPAEQERTQHVLLADDHKGMRVDYTGLFKQARGALARGMKEPALAEMLRQLQEHLTELGQRWYAGDAAAVDEILQLYCIEKDARAAIKSNASQQAPSTAAQERDAIADITAERERQKSAEGWTPEHDDEHEDRSIALAASCYLSHYISRQWLTEEPDGLRQYQSEELPDDWPMNWHEDWWKPKNPRRDLVRAAALIAAEIDRMDRAALAHKTGEQR